MKKWLVALFSLALIFSLAACGNDAKDEKETEKKDVSADAMNFYMDLVAKINDNDADYDAYQAAIGSDTPPTGAELTKLADAASASADKVSKALEDFKVPNLGTSTDVFKTAVGDLSKAYADEATGLKASPIDTKSADEAMQKASDALGKALKDVGLAPSNIMNDTAA
ncbi:lipoprotein [Listeria weihenstephanensis FSL R9-0317]|uniref:Lipoprotein n=1 Tax=Listeria weihenstephanensis TaxID=1006155 RepID=A0A1S7FU86_9LIST|nr:hypothetical protein [Listeria weihenstephanensis]AQY51016.1 hypothetical protein UE46_08140 [Listeria weihenstephanensis]EUJ36432.1 lipoprotein [Listeria weihenstephanensis FSL R9-0317]